MTDVDLTQPTHDIASAPGPSAADPLQDTLSDPLAADEGGDVQMQLLKDSDSSNVN